MAADNSIRSPLDRPARLLRGVAWIAEARRCAASVCPERDQALKSRLMAAGTASGQLAAHARRQGGAV